MFLRAYAKNKQRLATLVLSQAMAKSDVGTLKSTPGEEQPVEDDTGVLKERVDATCGVTEDAQESSDESNKVDTGPDTASGSGQVTGMDKKTYDPAAAPPQPPEEGEPVQEEGGNTTDKVPQDISGKVYSDYASV